MRFDLLDFELDFSNPEYKTCLLTVGYVAPALGPSGNLLEIGLHEDVWYFEFAYHRLVLRVISKFFNRNK